MIELRRCKTCLTDKLISEFHVRKESGRLRSECKTCWGKRGKAWVLKNPDARKAIANRWGRANNESKRAWKSRAREVDPLKLRKWNIEHPEEKKAINRRWAESHRPQILARVRARQAAKKMALPKWADLEAMKSLYLEAGILGLEVDHIIPLKHALVCGLHVETNLQLLTRHQNRSKRNIWPWTPK